MVQIAESAEYIAKVVRQRLHEIGVDISSEAKPATDDRSERVSLITDTIVALQTAGVMPTVTQLQSVMPVATAVPDKSESKHSGAKQSSTAESTDIVPNLSADVKAMKKSEQKDKRKWINWRDLVEEYSVAINNLNNETFEVYEETVCAKYLKRWMDALKVGFKRKEGQIHFGADKIAEAIPKFVLAVTQAIQDDTLTEFDEDFKRWELRARGEDTSATPDKQSFGLPYIVASLCDPDNIKKYANNELANDVYRDFLDGSLGAVSRVKHGAEHYEYLETTAISTLLKKAA